MRMGCSHQRRSRPSYVLPKTADRRTNARAVTSGAGGAAAAPDGKAVPGLSEEPAQAPMPKMAVEDPSTHVRMQHELEKERRLRSADRSFLMEDAARREVLDALRLHSLERAGRNQVGAGDVEDREVGGGRKGSLGIPLSVEPKICPNSHETTCLLLGGYSLPAPLWMGLARSAERERYRRFIAKQVEHPGVLVCRAIQACRANKAQSG